MEAMMQSWTDDRLDDLSKRMDERFDHVEADVSQRFDHVETEMRNNFKRVDREVKAGFECVDREMKAGFERVDKRFERIDDDLRELRGAMGALQRTLIQVGGGLIVAVVGLTLTQL